MLLVALSMAGESRSLQENLSQKESLEGSLPYVEQIRKAECEKQDLKERLKRVSKEKKQFQEQLKEYKSQLRNRETRLENVETQLRELQEQFTILEERRERETCNLQDELEIKIQEFDGVEREMRDREQDIVQRNRDLLDRERELENVQTQLRELQEQFTTLEERRERETCNLQDELEIKRQELDKVEREMRDREQDIGQLNRNLLDRETELENVQTQLRELQEQFTTLEERRERETCNLQDEIKIKREKLDELEREMRDREQDIGKLNRDLLDRETELDNVQTQLRELQEEFTILKEQEREKCNLQDQLINKREELDELERVLRDREQDIVQQKRDLIDCRETKMFREIVQTQLRELKEKVTILEENKLKEKETCDLQDELKSKKEELDELGRELRDREQDIVELKRDLKEAKETKSNYDHELQLKTRDWILSRDEVELTDKRLGEGAFGIVLEGRYCDCPVAVKKLKEYNLTPEARSLFEREMDIASRCRHPCLLLFIGATIDESPPLLVTELMELSLRALLRKRQLSETEVSIISLDVARALEYLHQRKPTPIVHRDVSSANVLLWKQNDQWRGKLSDYGTAKFVVESMTTNPGADIYAAPETARSDYQTEVGLST